MRKLTCDLGKPGLDDGFKIEMGAIKAGLTLTEVQLSLFFSFFFLPILSLFIARQTKAEWLAYLR